MIVPIVLFVPWSRMSWGDIGETAGIFGFYGGLLAALAWWCTPVDQRRIFSNAAMAVPLQSTSFAEQVSGSLLLGSLLAVGLTLASLMGLSWLEPQWVRPLLGNATCLMLIVSAIATAVLLGNSQVMRLAPKSSPSKAWLAGLGVVVGTTAYGLDEFLLAEFPDLPDGSYSVFNHFGAHPLWNDRQPTVVAYLVFFAALFALQNWRKLLDPYRPRRLRVWGVAAAGLIGWLVSMFFGVPRPCAIVWAVAINTAVQLAAPWQPGAAASPQRASAA